MATLVWVAVVWVVGASALLAVAYRRAIAVAWNEPVLRAPVLIFESDDWGYGPLEQAARIDGIADLLAGFRDSLGRHPVMTLGVVLAGPDVETMRREGPGTYRRLTLQDPRLAPIRGAMLRGVARGVYALQLHGLEHFWPDCLLRAARRDATIADWLAADDFPSTEGLPPALQSRWIDAVDLPSSTLPRCEAEAAAQAEVRTFAAVFAAPPEVAVPPTFIWTREVEAAWARAGVRVVVTPGRRSEGRDGDGRPIYCSDPCVNGAVSDSRVSYVVRNNYFEPTLGHTHERVVADLRENTRLGRPTLVEMHRMNFMGDDQRAQCSLEELDRALRSVTMEFRDIRFMSTAELARALHDSSDLTETRLRTRIHALLARLAQNSRLRKLAWVTGAILPAWLSYVVTTPAGLDESRA